ncbi:restriction endonuclease subunit S [Leuconostoc falkenbergense]|uniref:Restriction endonuclease subunit S n=1 Tax=Leuconostoc falkenbergense TaxID=2766470 RepID=A0A9X3E9M9_9LACO|nr:restriction endonuclease subunit S [Leuconostoc falkenbergense]MCX7579826.1 restriction endonuclease subunit S [Leuconostoc falkenbergense]
MTKVKLGDYVSLQTHKVDNITAVNTSYVSTENLQPNKNGVLFPAASVPSSGKVNFYGVGDILVSNIRPYFKKIWMAINPGTHSSDVLNFRTKSPKLTQEYLYIVLESDSFFDYVTLTSKGTKMPRGDKDAIMDFEFSLPSLDVQQKLSNTIMALERKILMSKQVNDNLLELADATFEKNYEQQVGNQKLETLATVKGGKRLPKGAPLTEVKTQHPYLRITDYSKNGVPSVQSMQYITEEVFDKISRYVINEGEVFLSIVGTIGIVDLIDERLDNASLTENAVKIHAQTTAMAHYLYLYLRSDEGRHEIDSRTVGTTQKKLAITRIKDFDVGVISETDLQEFERTVSPLINMVLANRSEIDTLVQIRDSLLQELI